MQQNEQIFSEYLISIEIITFHALIQVWNCLLIKTMNISVQMFFKVSMNANFNLEIAFWEHLKKE